VENMLNRAQAKQKIRVVADEILSPTYALDLAQKTKELIRTDRFGLYHITNSGQCSWWEFTVKILEIAGIKLEIEKVTGAEYITPAARPKYSVLGHQNLKKIGLKDMRTWEEALKAYLADR